MTEDRFPGVHGQDSPSPPSPPDDWMEALAKGELDLPEQFRKACRFGPLFVEELREELNKANEADAASTTFEETDPNLRLTH